MISVFEIKMPEYKEYKIDNIEEKCKYKTRFYDLEDIPVTYIENSPDFDVTALRLRDFLRKYYSGKSLCVRGVSMAEHNYINNTAINSDDLTEIIINTGTDRYNPEICGKKYINIENKHIDFFAFDVVPCLDDDDLKYFFQSFYWYGIAESGKPVFVDVIIVYDAALLNRVEHHYEGRAELKRDGFVFPAGDKRSCIKCIIKTQRF